jgi:hypothetical protein
MNPMEIALKSSLNSCGREEKALQSCYPECRFKRFLILMKFMSKATDNQFGAGPHFQQPEWRGPRRRIS